MFRFPTALIIVVLSATPLVSLTECSVPFGAFFKSLKSTPLTGDELADAHRAGLRIYDACDTGHLDDVEYRLRRVQEKFGVAANSPKR